MASTKPPYDPVKALEGMFNGSVTRIGYVLKEPVSYAGFTNTVLTECAKRFHDALDDCEIQILDAKWYLEHQLAENKARREAKAREMGTAVKRKHDEIKEAGEPEPQEETPSKRSKVEAGADASPLTKPVPTTAQPEKAEPTSKPASTTKPTEQTPTQKSDQKKSQPAPSPKQDKSTESKEDPAQLSQDDFAKPTPQATPAGTNDDFNFESMFGDPAIDPGSNKEDDLTFDLGLGDDTFDTGADPTDGANMLGNQDSSSLDSLLPGLQTYANEPDYLNANTTTTSNSNNNNNGNNNNPAATTTSTTNNNNNTTNALLPDQTVTTTMEQSNNPSNFSNEFDLPEMGGANDFDDFLNDDSLGVGGGGTYGDGVDGIGGDDFLDMELDDSFFN